MGRQLVTDEHALARDGHGLVHLVTVVRPDDGDEYLDVFECFIGDQRSIAARVGPEEPITCVRCATKSLSLLKKEGA
jgi:hypothetical protein